MTGKRLKPETHIQIKILSEKGYSTRQIAKKVAFNSYDSGKINQ